MTASACSRRRRRRSSLDCGTGLRLGGVAIGGIASARIALVLASARSLAPLDLHVAVALAQLVGAIRAALSVLSVARVDARRD